MDWGDQTEILKNTFRILQKGFMEKSTALLNLQTAPSVDLYFHHIEQFVHAANEAVKLSIWPVPAEMDDNSI